VLYCEAGCARLSYEQVVGFIILYNIIAFGLQAPLGLLADVVRGYRAMAVAGLLVTALAVGVSPMNGRKPCRLVMRCAKV
jgi:hypothetical protein